MFKKSNNIFFLILIVCFAIYGASLGFTFLSWDDDVNIFRNVWMETEGLSAFWLHSYYGLYIPVTFTVWKILALGQIMPLSWACHLFNIVFHCINSFLVFQILQIILDRHGVQKVEKMRPALAGALIFAVHPLQVETVAWASGMRDLLGATFSLIAVYIFLRNSSLKSNLLATGLFFFGMLSKPSIISVPAGILVGSFFLCREQIKKQFKRLIPWFVVSLPLIYVTKMAQGYAQAPDTPLWQRPLVAIDALGFYLVKLVLPFNLGPDYGRKPQWVLENQTYFLTGLIVFVLVIFLLTRKNKDSRILNGGFFSSAALLLPVLGLIPFAFQHTSTVADHYMYLPMFGVSLFIAQIVSSFADLNPKNRGQNWGGGLIIGGLAITSISTSLHWKDDRAFFAHMLKINPTGVGALNAMSNFATQDGDLELAAKLAKKASDIFPENAVTFANYAIALGRLKKDKEILETVAPRLPPDEMILANKEAWAYFSSFYSVIAGAQFHSGQTQKAIISLCRSMDLDPQNPDAVLMVKEHNITCKK